MNEQIGYAIFLAVVITIIVIIVLAIKHHKKQFVSGSEMRAGYYNGEMQYVAERTPMRFVDNVNACPGDWIVAGNTGSTGEMEDAKNNMTVCVPAGTSIW
jgi:hypothetical protein